VARRRLLAGWLASAATLLLHALPGLAKDPPETLPPPPPPDAAFFAKEISPWLDERCASCHRAGGGSFRMATPAENLPDEQRVDLDFRSASAFVDRNAPWQSRLLTKVLEPGEGGDPHVGGPFVAVDDEDYDVLLDFCSGATLRNLPPEAFLGPDLHARPGETVAVDGRGSFDRDRDDSLVYRWELLSRPAGSRVLLSDRRASRIEVTPDTGGTFVLRLRVSDGKVWSAPREVSIEVFDYVVVRETKPGAVSGLAKADDAGLKRIRRLYLDVLGRPPTPGEAVAEERRPYWDLVANVLLRAESGRNWVEDATDRLGLVDDLRPSGDEAGALALRIPAENVAPAAAEAILVRDPSFLRAHPPGRTLAEAIARRLLDRAPTPEELAAAQALAEGRPAEVPGLGAVADGGQWLERVIASEEFAKAAVRRWLARWLPSGPVEKNLNAALLAIRNGPAAWRKFQETLLLSPDYLGRRELLPKRKLTFLRSLFWDLLERRPTDRELVALARAVDLLPGASAPYAAVAKVLVDSGQVPIPLLVDIEDAPAWIIDRFLRYLGRRPTPAELKGFGQALLDPLGGPELVMLALLTSPEYACR
jgi:hypothetical protein